MAGGLCTGMAYLLWIYKFENYEADMSEKWGSWRRTGSAGKAKDGMSNGTDTGINTGHEKINNKYNSVEDSGKFLKNTYFRAFLLCFCFFIWKNTTVDYWLIGYISIIHVNIARAL